LGISYHSKVGIRISADLQKVKYRPIVSVCRYIGQSLIQNMAKLPLKKSNNRGAPKTHWILAAEDSIPRPPRCYSHHCYKFLSVRC